MDLPSFGVPAVDFLGFGMVCHSRGFSCSDSSALLFRNLIQDTRIVICTKQWKIFSMAISFRFLNSNPAFCAHAACGAVSGS